VQQNFDLSPECGKVVLHDIPDNIPVYPKVIMNQFISHSYDLSPLDLRMFILEILG